MVKKFLCTAYGLWGGAHQSTGTENLWVSLLEFFRDDESGRYVVIFNPKIMALYEGGWTAIDWQARQLFRGRPLALWLHGYLASHAKPYPIKIEKLRAFSGSNNKAVRFFKRKLIAALNELKKIQFIRDYAFEDDNIIINNPPTASQQRFLISC